MARLLIPLFCLLSLAQCGKDSRPGARDPSPPPGKFTYHQPLMGTRFSLVLYADGKKNADTAAKAAFDYAAEVNRVCSDYDVTSELMQLNAAPANVAFQCSAMLHDVLTRAAAVARQTQGAYDPTLGWHSYNWRMARKKGVLPDAGTIARAKAASGWEKLSLDPARGTATKLAADMRIDLGGIAKGYAADGMLTILNRHHITRACIVAGGDVLLGDPPPGKVGWEISLRTLDADHSLTPATLTESNCAISTSGDIHQSATIGGKRYSHVVDPGTGLGLTRRVSATVTGRTATLTDALATAFCVNPRLVHPGARAIIVIEHGDGSLGTMTRE